MDIFTKNQKNNDEAYIESDIDVDQTRSRVLFLSISMLFAMGVGSIYRIVQLVKKKTKQQAQERLNKILQSKAYEQSLRDAKTVDTIVDENEDIEAVKIVKKHKHQTLAKLVGEFGRDLNHAIRNPQDAAVSLKLLKGALMNGFTNWATLTLENKGLDQKYEPYIKTLEGFLGSISEEKLKNMMEIVAKELDVEQLEPVVLRVLNFNNNKRTEKLLDELISAFKYAVIMDDRVVDILRKTVEIILRKLMTIGNKHASEDARLKELFNIIPSALLSVQELFLGHYFDHEWNHKIHAAISFLLKFLESDTLWKMYIKLEENHPQLQLRDTILDVIGSIEHLAQSDYQTVIDLLPKVPTNAIQDLVYNKFCNPSSNRHIPNVGTFEVIEREQNGIKEFLNVYKNNTIDQDVQPIDWSRFPDLPEKIKKDSKNEIDFKTKIDDFRIALETFYKTDKDFLKNKNITDLYETNKKYKDDMSRVKKIVEYVNIFKKEHVTDNIEKLNKQKQEIIDIFNTRLLFLQDITFRSIQDGSIGLGTKFFSGLTSFFATLPKYVSIFVARIINNILAELGGSVKLTQLVVWANSVRKTTAPKVKKTINNIKKMKLEPFKQFIEDAKHIYGILFPEIPDKYEFD